MDPKEQTAKEETDMQGDPQQKEDEAHQEDKPRQQKMFEEMRGVREIILTEKVVSIKPHYV